MDVCGSLLRISFLFLWSNNTWFLFGDFCDSDLPLSEKGVGEAQEAG